MIIWRIRKRSRPRRVSVSSLPRSPVKMTVTPRSPLPFVSRTKERDYGNAHRCGHVHGTRVDAEKKVRCAIYGKISVQVHRPAKIQPIKRAAPLDFPVSSCYFFRCAVLFDNGLQRLGLVHGAIGDRVFLGNWGALRFEVRDTGIGIAPEVLPRLFQAFHQADGSMSRRYGGTGLGLAIVKHLVIAHGGELTIDSTLGEGTTVRFTLPTDGPAAPSAPRS